MSVVLDLFDKYFLFLIFFQTVVLTTYDYKKFKSLKQDKSAKKARIFGIGGMFIALFLYVLRMLLM